MGNLPEWGQLCLQNGSYQTCVTLPETSVFEDIAPRLYDLDDDGTYEAVVVESTFAEGAALVVYAQQGADLIRIATPHIGTRNRWLALLGAADLDGDGYMELAFIDRPHLAKTLHVWRYKDRQLSRVATLKGLTNHKIGEAFISGGIRHCNGAPEIITASANWTKIMATQLIDGALKARKIGDFTGPKSLRDAVICP